MRHWGRATAAMALAAGLAQPALANSDAAAAIVGAAAGVAIGAALVNAGHHHGHKGASFSPKPGVVCYDKQRACYHADGSFAAHATWEAF